MSDTKRCYDCNKDIPIEQFMRTMISLNKDCPKQHKIFDQCDCRNMCNRHYILKLSRQKLYFNLKVDNYNRTGHCIFGTKGHVVPIVEFRRIYKERNIHCPFKHRPFEYCVCGNFCNEHAHARQTSEPTTFSGSPFSFAMKFRQTYNNPPPLSKGEEEEKEEKKEEKREILNESQKQACIDAIPSPPNWLDKYKF